MASAYGEFRCSPYYLVGVSGVSNLTLDDVAAQKGLAATFQAYSTDPITHVGFRYGARTGTPPTYKTGLMGLDSSGNPDGTYLGGGSPASMTFTPPADTTINGLWQWKQLDNAYTPDPDVPICWIVEHDSGTVNSSNCSSFTNTYGLGSQIELPGRRQKAAGSWSKNGNPHFGWRTASGRFGYVAQDHVLATISVSTVGHRHGMFFTLRSGHGSTFKVRAIEMYGYWGSGSFKAGIWTTGGTEKQATATQDSDLFLSATAGNRGGVIVFKTPVALDYGTKYYAALEVTSGAVGVQGHKFAEADDRLAWPGGDDRGVVTYNGSAWSEVATEIPNMRLHLDDITVPSGGGDSSFIIGG